ncbi:protoporphyrinogen/coproporphyrinogen oxidase [Streptomyces sp. NPDC002159]
MAADIAVVGGGWSGIAAAWRLQQAGHAVTLYDDQDRLGGRSAGVRLGERTLTAGGKNIGRKYSIFRSFTAELGRTDWEFFGINSTRSDGGQDQTVDSTKRVSSLFHLLKDVPPGDLVRGLKVVRAVRSRDENRFLAGAGLVAMAAKKGDPTLAEHFGPVLRKKLIRTLTVRMNGAEDDEVHLECFGTHLGMAMDTFEQLSSGFEDLFERFGKHVTFRGNTRVTDLKSLREQHDAVLVALPAHAAASLLAPLSGDLAEELRGIRYFPAAVLLAEYDRPVFGEQARAFVQPAGSPMSNAGAYGVNDRHIVRYTFSGRAYRTTEHTDEELLDLAEAQLSKQTGVAGAKRIAAVTKRWERAYCGYSRHHSARLERIDQALKPLDRLELTGDYRRGASIEACFRAGYENADKLLKAL